MTEKLPRTSICAGLAKPSSDCNAMCADCARHRRHGPILRRVENNQTSDREEWHGLFDAIRNVRGRVETLEGSEMLTLVCVLALLAIGAFHVFYWLVLICGGLESWITLQVAVSRANRGSPNQFSTPPRRATRGWRRMGIPPSTIG